MWETAWEYYDDGVDAFEGVVGSVTGTVTGAIDSVGDTVEDVVDNVTDTVSGAIEDVTSVPGEVIGPLTALGAVAGTLATIAPIAITGLGVYAVVKVVESGVVNDALGKLKFSVG